MQDKNFSLWSEHCYGAWLLWEEDRNVRKIKSTLSALICFNRLVEIMFKTLQKDFNTYLVHVDGMHGTFLELWFLWSFLILQPWAHGKGNFSSFVGHFSVNTWFLQPCKRNCYSLLLTVTPSIDSSNVTFVAKLMRWPSVALRWC